VGIGLRQFLLTTLPVEKNNARIWHTKENGQFFEYCQYTVNKNTVALGCAYHRTKYVNCPGRLMVKAKRPDLINYNKIKGRIRYFLNHDEPLNKDDWEIVEGSGTREHAAYCCNQVEKRNRIFDKNILNHGTPAEVRKEKRKYPKFGLFGGFNRGFRYTHTTTAQNSKRVEIDSTSIGWNVEQNHGARFLAMVSSITAERRSSYYNQSKNRDEVSGISAKSLIVRNPITMRAIEEMHIHLTQKTENFIPVYLQSELHKLQNRVLFGDGTSSLCRNLNFCQIYIFSVSINEMGRTFNYPLFCFLMKKRTKKHYDEILNFMKNVFFSKFQENREIQAIHVDCARPFIKSVKENFPKTSIVLCSIHIIRAILRNNPPNGWIKAKKMATKNFLNI